MQEIIKEEEAWWFILSQGKIVALDKGDLIPFGDFNELPFPDPQ